MPTPAECITKEGVRAEIDRLDRELVALLGERFSYVRRMAEVKRDPAEAADSGRVEAVLTRVATEAESAGLDPALIRAMWQLLIDWNIAYEKRTIGHGQ